MQAWEHWRKGRALEIMDPSMGGFSSDEALRCIQVGLLCTQEFPTDRPPMSSVSLMLHVPSMALQAPSLPKFAGGINMADSTVSSKISELSSSEEFASNIIVNRHEFLQHNLT